FRPTVGYHTEPSVRYVRSWRIIGTSNSASGSGVVCVIGMPRRLSKRYVPVALVGTLRAVSKKKSSHELPTLSLTAWGIENVSVLNWFVGFPVSSTWLRNARFTPL